MNKDTVKGAARQMRGTIKETTGKLTGNTKLQAEGATQKIRGKATSAVGKAEVKMKHAADRM